MSLPHRKRCKSYNIPGDAHELNFSCFRRLPLLSKERTCQWFLDALDQARRRLDFALWAYVLMPEHIHVILCRTMKSGSFGLLSKCRCSGGLWRSSGDRHHRFW